MSMLQTNISMINNNTNHEKYVFLKALCCVTLIMPSAKQNWLILHQMIYQALRSIKISRKKPFSIVNGSLFFILNFC